MKRVFWAHTMSSIGASLVTIFIPIFLLNTGYAFTAVMGFIFAQSLISALGIYPVAWLVSRIGANKGAALGLTMDIIYFAMLLTLDTYHWPLVLLAAAWALCHNAYWVSFHANFSKSRSHEKTGKQVSAINSIITFAHGLTPAIGGILATKAGIGWVYVIAIVFLFLALIPLLAGKEVTKRRPFKPKQLDVRKIWRDPASNTFNGATTLAEVIFWPLLIFFIVDSYAGVGILSSIVIVASITVALYVGKREATQGERHFMRRGLLLETCTNILRAIASTAAHVFGINLINGVSRSLYTTPYMTRYYRHADEEPRLEYIAIMETATQAGGMLLAGAVFALSFYLSPQLSLLVGVLLAAPASFGTRLIR